MTTKPQSTTEPELKPCPFCGSRDLDLSNGYDEDANWVVVCRTCKSGGTFCVEKAKAIARWNARVSASVAPTVDEKDNSFIFRHGADCAWERTTTAECEYKDTHNYCPHPEHACTCPQISGEISDNPTLEEAEAYLRANGVTLEDVGNAFIERLLQENLRLKKSLASFVPPSTVALRDESGPRRCVKCNHADTNLGRDGRCRAIVLGPDAMSGSGMAHCACRCEFATPVAPVEQSKARYEKAHDARYVMTHPVHPDIVVLWFLALKSHWFDDPKNIFFGYREKAKAYLYKWVETGELADDNTTLEIATAMKFREWLASSWTAAAPSAATQDEASAVPPDLIAFKWAETLSAGEQSVLLTSSLKRLQGMINEARQESTSV